MNVDPTDLVDQLLTQMQDSFTSHLTKFKNLIEEDSSVSALTEIESLYQDLLSLQQVLVNQPCIKELDIDKQAFEKIAKDVEDIEIGVEVLRDNLGKIELIEREIGKDAGEEEMIEIIDVGQVDGQLKRIKIRSDEKNSGNFRGISIWDVENGEIVCKVLMIEPGAEVKIMTDVEICVDHHLVAKVDERFVSFVYRVPKVKIVNIAKKEKIEVAVKNLCDFKVSSFCVIANQNKVEFNLTLVPFELIVFEIDLDLRDNTVFYIEKDGELLSSAYEFKPEIDPDNSPDILSDLTSSQLNLVKMALDRGNYLKVSEVKNKVLTYNPESLEELMQILSN